MFLTIVHIIHIMSVILQVNALLGCWDLDVGTLREQKYCSARLCARVQSPPVSGRLTTAQGQTGDCSTKVWGDGLKVPMNPGSTVLLNNGLKVPMNPGSTV